MSMQLLLAPLFKNVKDQEGRCIKGRAIDAVSIWHVWAFDEIPKEHTSARSRTPGLRRRRRGHFRRKDLIPAQSMNGKCIRAIGDVGDPEVWDLRYGHYKWWRLERLLKGP